ncbi:MAG TPA: 50S ribosomal protein L3 [Thermotogota bacterium]|nr:50S ribosomal protein L3 [Thermotogota bacterium]HPJ88179.1 50S ribosomal protein L3 [Thermotogota bacterium]HPR95612.1 50S ribosomal protein L3 [Thermotogota bacterium]
MSGLIGKKIGMTQIYKDGKRIPVTVVQAGPCVVVQKKTEEVDGYTSIQLGFEKQKEQRMTKPVLGHFKKANVEPMKHLKEFRVDDVDAYELGQEITVELFEEGTKVDVVGVSKGKGYSGAMKRWNFSGGEKSHGSKFHRALGSTGQHSYPARVFPGKKMPGQYGNTQVTVQNLEIVRVDKENNLLAVKGAIPGARNSLVYITNTVKSY